MFVLPNVRNAEDVKFALCLEPIFYWLCSVFAKILGFHIYAVHIMHVEFFKK